MSSIVSIEPIIESAAVDPGDSHKYSFSVINTSGKPLSIGAKALTDDPTKEEWFRVDAPAERAVGDGELDKFDVTVAVPADAAAESLDFRLLVYSTHAPNEDYTEGPNVKLTIKDKTGVSPVSPEPTGSRWGLWAGIVAGVLLLLGGGGFMAYKFLLSDKPVPDLAGMTINDAALKLAKLDLRLDESGLTEKYTGNFDQGTINSQTPAAGEKSPERLVSVTVEQFRILMPDIKGLTATAAENELQSLGLILSPDITFEQSDRFAGGAVIAQNPKANDAVVPNTEVSVTVAKKIINMPDLIGKPFRDATAILQASELTLGTVETQQAGGNPETVIRQDPPPNTQTDAFAKVDLSIVEKQVKVPKVLKMKIGDAQKKLTDAGFKVIKFSMPVPPNTKPNQLLIVQRQDPSANQMKFAGSEVVLGYYPKLKIFIPTDLNLEILKSFQEFQLAQPISIGK